MCQGRTVITTAITSPSTASDKRVVESVVSKQPVEPERGSEHSSSTMSDSDDDENGMESSMVEDAKLMCATGNCVYEHNNTGKRQHSRSRQLSTHDPDNRDLTPPHDLEEIAFNVLSPTIVNRGEGPIVVDYEEGVPDQSRATLLLEGNDCGSKAECTPSACQPLGLQVNGVLAFTDIKNSDAAQNERTLLRRRSTSLSSSSQASCGRRGKSVILNSINKPVTDPRSPLLKSIEIESAVGVRCSSVAKLCLCEVRLHITRESCWMVANNSVYDVTGMLDCHPGGTRSILRKAGGVDCTEDMQFHSKSARKSLEKCFIGRLQPCGANVVACNGGGLPSCCVM